MLIEFSVSNWRSIKETQTLSLVAAPGNELPDQVFSPDGGRTRLLTSAAIYGPNAAGKSNLIGAVAWAQKFILNCATRMQRGDEIEVKPFLLDDTFSGQPSDFEFDFFMDGVRYQYGFSVNRERVLEEWLFASPNGRAQRWLGRIWHDGQYHWQRCTALPGAAQIQPKTRDNALFLSTAVQWNLTKVQPMFDWFSKQLRMVGPGGWDARFSEKNCDDAGKRKRILRLLTHSDLGIADLMVEKKKFTVEMLPGHLDESSRTRLAQDMEDSVFTDIKTLHRTIQGTPVMFDLDSDESDGTRRMFALAAPLLDVLENGYIVLVDELGIHLHPELVQALIRLFNHPLHNPKHAQLIFTTHETALLDQALLRRDQIWFCEKRQDQATRLYPLTDFHPRKGSENLEGSYRSGRYGAQPFVPRNVEPFNG
jgi:uncharacterized protein